jgi:hypothetical protein
VEPAPAISRHPPATRSPESGSVLHGLGVESPDRCHGVVAVGIGTHGPYSIRAFRSTSVLTMTVGDRSLAMCGPGFTAVPPDGRAAVGVGGTWNTGRHEDCTSSRTRSGPMSSWVWPMRRTPNHAHGQSFRPPTHLGTSRPVWMLRPPRSGHWSRRRGKRDRRYAPTAHLSGSGRPGCRPGSGEPVDAWLHPRDPHTFCPFVLGTPFTIRDTESLIGRTRVNSSPLRQWDHGGGCFPSGLSEAMSRSAEGGLAFPPSAPRLSSGMKGHA